MSMILESYKNLSFLLVSWLIGHWVLWKPAKLKERKMQPFFTCVGSHVCFCCGVGLVCFASCPKQFSKEHQVGALELERSLTLQARTLEM